MIETRNPARIAELPDVPAPTPTELPQEAEPRRPLPRRLLDLAWPTRRKGTALTLGLGVVALGIAFHPLWLSQMKETTAAEPEKPIEPPKLPAKTDETKPTDKPVTVEPVMPELNFPAPLVRETKTDPITEVKLPPPSAELLKSNPVQPKEQPAEPAVIPKLNLEMPDLTLDKPSNTSALPAPIDLNNLPELEAAPSVEATSAQPLNVEPLKLEAAPAVETLPIVRMRNEEPATTGVPAVNSTLPPTMPMPNIAPLETPNLEKMSPIPSTTTEMPPADLTMPELSTPQPTPSAPPPTIEPVVEQPKPIEPTPTVEIAPMQPLKQPYQKQPPPSELNMAPQPQPRTIDVAPQPEPIAVNPEPTISEPTTNFDVDIHAVQPSDSYGSLSQRYYGSDRYAEGLQVFNRGMRLMPGVEVKVPPMYVLRQRGESREPSIMPTSSTVSQSSNRDLTWSSASTNQRLQYVVPHNNMTLWDVAEDRYGDRMQWNKLYAANPQLDPNALLEAGMVLRLPEPTRR